ncbi:hypothetical protein TNCV_4512951 [Trichonephila clavipes]|nr:hypothetical protein TNCV_4512951 [Trichonephila clavipes]
MEAYNIDCALVQEHHSYRSTLPGYPSTYRLFYDPNSDIIKAAIIVRSRHLSTFIDYKNSDYNMVTLEVIAGSTAFTLFSYYFEPSKNIDSDLHKISQVFSSKNLNRLVWSMDSNSKSELWFSPYSDARGNKLSEFIFANNLFIINEVVVLLFVKLREEAILILQLLVRIYSRTIRVGVFLRMNPFLIT